MKFSKFGMLAGTFLLSMLVLGGCGKKADSSNYTKTATDKSVAKITRDPTAKYKTPFKVKLGVQEQVTYQGKETATNNAWSDLYKSTGMNVDYIYTVPQGTDVSEKLEQAVMSGNYPDVFQVSVNKYKDLIKQGLIADVSKYYKNGFLSKESKKYLNYDGGKGLSMVKVNGKSYGIPQLTNDIDGTSVLWVRKDWLNKLGLKEPKTAADVQKVAAAFANDDPDGNGKNDTYGFGMQGKDYENGEGGFARVFNLFGAMPISDAFVKSADKSKLVWSGQDQSGMTAGLKMLNQMYKSGSIIKDFSSTDSVKLRSNFAAGKFGMMVGPMYWLMDYLADAEKSNPKADFVALPMPTSKENPKGKAYRGTTVAAIYVVSSKCKHPEALFKIFNQGVHYISYGNHRSQADYEKYDGGLAGKYSGGSVAVTAYMGDPADNYLNYKAESKALVTGDTSKLTMMQKSHYDYEKFYLDNKDNIANLKGADWDKFKQGANFYSVFGDPNGGFSAVDKMVKRNQWFAQSYLQAPSDTLKSNLSNTKSLISESLTKIIMGQSTVNSYPDFLKQWKSRGGQSMLTEINKWYKTQQ